MIPDPTSRLAVIIPAYRPSAGLIDLVQILSQKALPAIVIVDDGSGPEFREIFERAAQFPKVQLLRHAVNLGKGAALKTAFNYALCTWPDLVGVVTGDADGQHHPDDIEAVARRLEQRPDSLVLGCRSFGKDVPLRSRFGNIATRKIMHALLGQKLTDTQTGLRGIPATLLPKLLRTESTGYEFELEMLIAAHQLEIRMVEEPIRTIYEEGNKSSHFNPIVDSMKIYFVLLRFGSVSAMTALIDNLISILVIHQTGNVLGALILGRSFAVAFNYWMVRSSVFYSKQQHKSVLPKYLTLVVVSGTAAYQGIQYLHAQFGISPIPAKLMVETLLFFVNFAVQRLFIFKPQGKAPSEEKTTRTVVLGGIIALVFAILIGAEIHGLRTAQLFSQEIWFPVGWKRFTRYIGFFLALAVPLLLMVPWTFAGGMAALLIVLTAVSVGPQPLIATSFFLISACALGSKLFGRAKADSAASHICSTLAGAGVLVFVMLITARLPVHYPITWTALLAVPILWDLQGVRRRMVYWVDLIRNAELRCPWERATFALLVFFVIAQWFVAVKPETSTDGLAMHLAIPLDIAANHRLTFEPSRFLWSVMPMGADWGYSIVALLGGEYAARLLNFAMLLAILALIYEAARRWVSPGVSFLLAASFAATPVVQLVTGSLFVENYVAALVLGILTATWQFGRTGERRYLFLAAVMSGAAVTAKIGSLAFVLLVLPYLAVEIVKHRGILGRRAWAAAGIAAVLFLSMALPTYAIAYAKTGNPIFPFNNLKIHSPLLDPTVDVNDGRFHIPLDHTTLYMLTFRSSEAYEGQNGSFGFQYMVLAPLALVGLLLFSSNRAAQSCVVVAWGAGLVIMLSQPNVRYLYAALPPLLVSAAVLLGWLRQNQRWMYRALLVFLAASTGLNAYFLPSASYYHKDFCLRLPFSRAERDRFLADGAPIRKLVEYFNRNHAGSAVLFTSDNEFAGIRGTVYENHWHQYPTVAALREAQSPEELFRLLQRWKVEYFIAHKPAQGEKLRPPSLQKLLAVCATPEQESGELYLAHLEPDCNERVSSMRVADRPALTVPPGFYDDLDPAILFRGDWGHDENFAQPMRHTVSYTDLPGADIMISFAGKALVYVFTKAPNRGVASVTIDGVDVGKIDLYSPKVEWQQSKRFVLGQGKHLATVKVTGEHQTAATGKFVDVDAFVVE